MSVQKNTLFASIFFFHTVCQYIFFSFCTGIGKCWYASTKKSILYWHEDRDFYDVSTSVAGGSGAPVGVVDARLQRPMNHDFDISRRGLGGGHCRRTAPTSYEP